MSLEAPAGWSKQTVGQLIDDGVLRIGDGYRAKNSELASTGIPFARAANVRGGVSLVAVDLLDYASVSKAGEKQSQPGDVVFTSKGTVGRFAYVAEADPTFVYSPQLCFWRSRDRHVLDARFLYFWMHGKECSNWFWALKGQTDMADYISLRDQRLITVTLPPIQEQRRIAAVLGALDDAVRASASLAHRLSRLPTLWFAHNFGEALGGARLGDEAQVVRGRSYKSVELLPSQTALVTLKCFLRGGGYSPVGLKPYVGDYRSEQVVEPGDVVVAQTDLTQDAEVIGRPAIVPDRDKFDRLVASLDLAIVRPASERVSSLWLYHLLNTPRFNRRARAYANGSTVLHLGKEAVPDFPLALPDPSQLIAFDRLAAPIHQRMSAAAAERRRLTAISERLLPKLVVGQVRVPETYEPTSTETISLAELNAPDEDQPAASKAQV